MMIDAYILGAKRIGHGFNLFRYNELEKKLIEEKIALEVCLISNQLLGYISDLRDHPAKDYLKHGIPVVLAPDDPLMFSTAGSTYDFYAAVIAWNLGLSELKQICLNSIEYSGGTDEERTELKALWQKSWDDFIKRGVKNIPVVEIPRPYQKNVTTLEELYEMDRKAQDEFNTLMTALQRKR